MKAYWDEMHRKNDAWMLTGDHYVDTESVLRMSTFLKPGMNVMEVGIGFGYCTKELKQKFPTINMYALDISQLAVDRVKDVIVEGYTDAKDIPTDLFDVIYSQLVFQHVNNETFNHMLKHIIAGLTHKGVFLFQIAGVLNPEGHPFDESEINMQSGGVCRTQEYIEECVVNNGGKVWSKYTHSQYPQYNSQWYVYAVTKA